MLSCQTGCCEACFILFRSCVSIPDCFIFVKMIIWRELCLRLFLGCDFFFFFNWFHSNPNKQKLTEYIYFGFCQNIWTWTGFLTTSGSTVCSNSPSVHKYCLEIMQVQGPPTWTNIHNFTLQYLTLAGCIWHREAYYPPKFVDQNNNYLNVMSEYFAHYETTTTTTEENHSTLPLVLRWKFNHCIRG